MPGRFDQAPRRPGDAFAVLRAALAGKGLLAVIDQALVSGTSFLTVIVLGRFSSPHELGLYSLGFSVVVFALCAQGALISAPYTYFANELDGPARADYAGNSLLHQGLLAGLATLLLGMAGIASLLGVLPHAGGTLDWVLAATMPLFFVREFIRRVAFAHMQVMLALLIDAAVAALQVGGLLVLALAGRLTAATALGLAGMACGIAGLCALGAMRKSFSPRPKDVLPDLRRNWSFGKWSFAGQMVLLVHAYAMPWLLAWLKGDAAAGVFAACLNLIMFANPLLSAFTNILGPRSVQAFTQGGTPALRQVAGAMARQVAATVGAFGLFLVLFGGRLLVLLSGEQFSGSGATVAVLAISMVVFALALAPDNGLWAMGRPDLNLVANLCGLGVTVALGLLLVGSRGVLGAGVAALAGNLTAAGTKQLAFLRYCRPATAGEG